MNLKELNPEQKEATTCISGPLLILAGAGSGKTKTLTHRIVYLMKGGIPAHNILAVTFSNKAANEMKTRIKSLLMESLKEKNPSKISFPYIGTFHSLAARILREEISAMGIKRDFAIYDESDQIALVKKIMDEMSLPKDKFKPYSVLQLISKTKNDFTSPEDFIATGPFEKTMSGIYSEYTSRLKKLNALDFDDLLLDLVKLFKDYPAILDKYRNLFEYILVDEYQDTNNAQYLILKLLAMNHRNICAVGDDMQAIYGWRGANFQNMLDFEKDYPEAKVIFLEENYRSTKRILQAANSVISKNSKKKDKNLWTKNDEGEKIHIARAANERKEADYIVGEIKKLKRGSLKDWNDFAVLYRTNAQSRVLEQAFLEQGIPYEILGSVRFYDRKEVKDILSYLRLALNKEDEIAFGRVINSPKRGIGQKSIEKISDVGGLINTKEDLAKKLKPQLFKKFKPFYLAINKLESDLNNSELDLEAILRHFINDVNYKAYLDAFFKEPEQRWENILELLALSSTYKEKLAKLSAQKMLEELAIYESDSIAEKIKAPADGVRLMTMHSAKGLEFPVVFIAGCEEGLLPHKMSMEEIRDIEEERRLFYVGITRAEQILYLTCAVQRKMLGDSFRNPSRFLNDIPKDLYTYKDLADEIWEEDPFDDEYGSDLF